MIATFGEVLMRLSTSKGVALHASQSLDVHYGGAEVNVAVALSHLGHSVFHTSKLPPNATGKAAKLTLQKHGVSTDYLHWGGNRLGIYFLETGNGLKPSVVTYDRAYSSMYDLQPGEIDWHTVLSGVKWFHWSGITPAISASAASATMEAITVASAKGITISTDLNYRSKLWNYGKSPAEILEPMIEKCDIVFGGIDAPEKIFGIVPKGHTTTAIKLFEEDIVSVFEQLGKIAGRSTIFATTLRTIIHNSHHLLQGVVFDNHSLAMSKAYDMPDMVDRVGGGDAFMAGLIHGLVHQYGLQQLVDFATASSVLKHYIAGDFCTNTAEEVHSFLGGSGLKINR